MNFSISRGEWVLIAAGAIITAPIWIPAGLVYLGGASIAHAASRMPNAKRFIKRHLKRKHRTPLGVLKDAKKNIKEKRDSKNIFHTRDTRYFMSLAVEKEAEFDWAGAFTHYSEVISLDPRHAIALYGRGRLRFKMSTPSEGLYDEFEWACQDFTACLALPLESPEFGVKANVDGEEVTVCLHRADVLSLKATALIRHNQFHPAAPAVVRPDDETKYRDEKNRAAEAVLNEAIALDPRHDMALRQRGLILAYRDTVAEIAQGVKDLRLAAEIAEHNSHEEGAVFECQQSNGALHSWLNMALLRLAHAYQDISTLLPWTPDSNCLYPEGVHSAVTTMLALGTKDKANVLQRLPEEILCVVMEFAVDNIISGMSPHPDAAWARAHLGDHRDFWALYSNSDGTGYGSS
jgi:tetratricopeptide (TPR) repeat protein